MKIDEKKREIRRAKIKKRIISLYAKNPKHLSPRNVFLNNRAFMGRAERLFGTWQKAVEYAGINYEKVRKTKRWSKEKIKSEIMKREKSGIPLNAGEVKRDDNKLFCAGIKYFGSWGGAIRAAGLKYSRIIKQQKGVKREFGEGGSWSAEIIKQEIMNKHKKGERLNSYYIQINESRLFYAACEYFGGWKSAIESCGLDYSTIRRKSENYTNSIILKKIVKFAEDGNSLNYSSAERRDSVLLREALIRFGSWENALKMAGIETEGIRLRKKWDKETVLNEMEKFEKRYGIIKSYKLLQNNHALYKSALRHFGSIRCAIEVYNAGKNKNEVPKKYRKCLKNQVNR